MNNEIEKKRLERRIKRKDKRIAGLERKIQSLEKALSIRTLDLESLTKNLQNAVEQTLCNVRMIPVHSLGRHSVIAEVKTFPVEKIKND
jgi:predicted RNase H-like nuclease (RuvC/YqgF family)